MHTLSLFFHSAQAIFTIALLSAGGIILARLKLIDSNSLQVISRIIFHLLLPCMLFASFAETIDLDKLKELWVLPLTAFIYIVGGIALGAAAGRILKIRPERRGMVTASSGFANSMYLPIPLVAAICLTFPEFSGNAELKAVGMAYVSMFIITFSPMMWTLGFNILGERPHSSIKLSDIITPPVCGIIAGFAVANFPFAKNAFCADSGFLHPVFTACVSLGNAVVPCAMIVLGGSFAFSPMSEHVDRKSVFAVILVKLILLPLLAILYIKLLIFSNIIPHGTVQDTLLAIVMLIQAAVPPATTLIVISSLQKKNIMEMGSLLQWSYLTSLVTLTLFIVMGMRIFR
ncbi:MAG: AEC family transporter [Victivallales bacterium]